MRKFDRKLPERTKIVSVYLPPSLVKRIKVRAAEHESTISALFDRALRQYLVPKRLPLCRVCRCRRDVERPARRRRKR